MTSLYLLAQHSKRVNEMTTPFQHGCLTTRQIYTLMCRRHVLKFHTYHGDGETLHSSFNCSFSLFDPWIMVFGLHVVQWKPIWTKKNKFGRGKCLPYSPWWSNFWHRLNPPILLLHKEMLIQQKIINTRPQGPLIHVIKIMLLVKKTTKGPRTSLYTRLWRPKGPKKFKWMKSTWQWVDNGSWSTKYYVRPIRKRWIRHKTRGRDNKLNCHWLL